MAEQLNLTTPVSKPNTTTYHVERLVLDWDAGAISVYLKGNNNEALSKVYDATTSPTGTALMTALNKVDLSSRSLNQRIFDRLVLDNVLVGTVAGTVP